MVTLEQIAQKMQALGATRILVKPLSNNDNSKQQIYFGSDFDVVQDLPLGDIRSDGNSSRMGPIFKAPISLFWINEEGVTEPAPGAQIILYPKYPEIRLSGFLRGCSIAPNHLMQPPSEEERQLHAARKRGMVLGLAEGRIFAYTGSWEDMLSQEVANFVKDHPERQVFSVFYEYVSSTKDSQQELLARLRAIHAKGPIQSRRLQADGTVIPYDAPNGAGFTLESEFGIIPNGNASPDFMDWELKVKSKSNITLMTPEPDQGLYLLSYPDFMNSHANRRQPEQLYFTARHHVGIQNMETGLTLFMDGYDPLTGKITDSNGGYFLRNEDGSIAAGWTFSKLLNHWKSKHAKTCYVFYTGLINGGVTFYQFGPKIILAKGASIEQFLKGLATGSVIHDPGCKYFLNAKGNWVSKKRNQFRVSSRNMAALYDECIPLDLSRLQGLT